MGQIPNAKFLFCKCCFITDHTGSWMLITHARCCVSVFLYRTGNSCRCFIPTLSASMCKTFAFSGGTDELLVLWRLSKTPSMTGRSSGRNRTSRFCTTALSVFPIDLKGKAKKTHATAHYMIMIRGEQTDKCWGLYLKTVPNTYKWIVYWKQELQHVITFQR